MLVFDHDAVLNMLKRHRVKDEADFCRRTGLSRGAYSTLTRNGDGGTTAHDDKAHQLPNVRTMLVVCNTFGVTLNYFIRKVDK